MRKINALLNRLARMSLFAVLALSMSACVNERKEALSIADVGTFSFPSENSYWKGRKIDLVGTLDFPDTTSQKLPAMIMFPGSGGIGYRERTWGDFFLDNGIATFKVDYLSPRGMSTSDNEGPMSSYDVLGSLKILSTHPRVDKNRIGLIGFSRGGAMILGSLRYNKRDTGGVDPAVFVVLYPSCHLTTFDSSIPDAPILIINGDDDDMSAASICVERETEGQRHGKDVRALVVVGATHGFDGDMNRTVRFGGGTIRFKSDPKQAEFARTEALKTLKRAFGM